MYKITVESPVFEKKSKVEQWRLVASAISDEMKTIHGFNLKTRIPGTISTSINSQNIETAKDSKTEEPTPERS